MLLIESSVHHSYSSSKDSFIYGHEEEAMAEYLSPEEPHWPVSRQARPAALVHDVHDVQDVHDFNDVHDVHDVHATDVRIVRCLNTGLLEVGHLSTFRKFPGGRRKNLVLHRC